MPKPKSLAYEPDDNAEIVKLKPIEAYDIAKVLKL